MNLHRFVHNCEFIIQLSVKIFTFENNKIPGSSSYILSAASRYFAQISYYFSSFSVFKGSTSSALNTYPQEQAVSSITLPLTVKTSTSSPHFGHVLSSGIGVLYLLSHPSKTAMSFTSWCARMCCMSLSAKCSPQFTGDSFYHKGGTAGHVTPMKGEYTAKCSVQTTGMNF